MKERRHDFIFMCFNIVEMVKILLIVNWRRIVFNHFFLLLFFIIVYLVFFCEADIINNNGYLIIMTFVDEMIVIDVNCFVVKCA